MGGLVGLVGSWVFHAPKSESNSFSAQIVRTRVNQESVSMPIPVCMTYKRRPGAACFNETVGCVLWWLFLIWSPPVTSKLCSSSIQIHSQQPFLAKWRSVGCPVPRPMTKCTLSCDLWLEEYSEFLSFFGPRPDLPSIFLLTGDLQLLQRIVDMVGFAFGVGSCGGFCSLVRGWLCRQFNEYVGLIRHWIYRVIRETPWRSSSKF